MEDQKDQKTADAFRSLIDATKQFSQSMKVLRSLPGPPEYIICIHPAAAAGAYEKEKQTADLISRKAAINIAMQYCPDDDGSCSKAGADIREMLDELEDIPSAQPEIIRCKDCKHYQFTNNRAFGTPVKMCEWLGFEDFDDDDFCSRAERRANG